MTDKSEISGRRLSYLNPSLEGVSGEKIGVNSLFQSYPGRQEFRPKEGRSISPLESAILEEANKTLGNHYIGIEATQDKNMWKLVMRGGGYYPIDLQAFGEGFLRENGLLPEEIPHEPEDIYREVEDGE